MSKPTSLFFGRKRRSRRARGRLIERKRLHQSFFDWAMNMLDQVKGSQLTCIIYYAPADPGEPWHVTHVRGNNANS